MQKKSWLDKDKKLDMMKIGMLVRLFRGPFLNGFIRVTRFEFVKKRTLHRVELGGGGSAGHVLHAGLFD